MAAAHQVSAVIFDLDGTILDTGTHADPPALRSTGTVAVLFSA